jgi:CBS domain-containing protein
MHLVTELLRQKGHQVFSIAPEASALDAAKKMNQYRVGSLVVVRQGGGLAGIVTERDILTKVVAGEKPPAKTPVSEIMTEKVLTCTPRTPLDELRHTMRERRIRHVPVIEGAEIVGMASLGDLNVAETRTLSETIGYLEAYISR